MIYTTYGSSEYSGDMKIYPTEDSYWGEEAFITTWKKDEDDEMKLSLLQTIKKFKRFCEGLGEIASLELMEKITLINSYTDYHIKLNWEDGKTWEARGDIKEVYKEAVRRKINKIGKNL